MFRYILLLTFLSSSVQAAELTLHFIPSTGINWNSPASLIRSALRSQTSSDSHPIGHVNVELECQDAYVLTGMTGAANDEVRDLLIRKKYGFGLLYYTYEGYLESQEDIEKDLDERYSSGKVSYARYEISELTCQRLLTYYTEYKQFGYDSKYGLPNDPLKGEGAGCSAFAVSFLELAGVLTQDLSNAWSRTIQVQKELVGGPLTGEKIPHRKLLFAPNKWATEDFFPLFFYDPDKMYQWVLKLHEGEVLSRYPFVREEREGSLGVVFDVSWIETPTEPIWRVED